MRGTIRLFTRAEIKLSINLEVTSKDGRVLPPSRRTSRVYISKSCESRRCRRSRERKARKNNIGEKERVYLVLRVCRACNHRGTAKRPSTPSHSASRHSIFFSPRPLRPCRCARTLLFPEVPRFSRTDCASFPYTGFSFVRPFCRVRPRCSAP